MKAASIYLVGGYEVYVYHGRLNGDDDCSIEMLKIGYGGLFTKPAACEDVDRIIAAAENLTANSDKLIAEILKKVGIFTKPSRIVAVALHR